jgi:VanZ family protein
MILRPWRWPRRLKPAAFGLANAILLYLCLAPTKTLPSVQVWDKAEHGLAWTVLAGVALLLWPSLPGVIVIYTLTLGGAVEFLQAVLPFGRDGEFTDWIADSVGIALAVVGWALVRVIARARTRSEHA